MLIYWQGKEGIKTSKERASNKSINMEKHMIIKKVDEIRYLSRRQAEMCQASKIVTDRLVMPGCP